jgi:inward rectifier potassium channel
MANSSNVKALDNLANTPNEDLGLGAKVIQENQSRFINEDGSFNVHRKGVFERGAFSPYHALLSKTWPSFYAYLLSAYAIFTLIFTGLYLMAGRYAFSVILPEHLFARFGELFFFSIQILTTLGSSAIQPLTVLAKTIFALEAMTGILGFSVAAGLIFARLSNPAVRIIFSKQAVIAPYKDAAGNNGTAFMFRIINCRSNEFIDVSAGVTLSMIDKTGTRIFRPLKLERDTVLVFPLHWTVVHAITKESPLSGMSAEMLTRATAEFLITIAATDQDLAKRINVRHSYLHDEVAVGAKFTNIIERTAAGTVVVDPKRIHEIEPAELPKMLK